MVADLGLPLVQLGEKVQKQREAAVVFLHLAQVPGGGREGGAELHPGLLGRRVCLPHCRPFLPEKGSPYPGTEAYVRSREGGGQGSVSYHWMLT